MRGLAGGAAQCKARRMDPLLRPNLPGAAEAAALFDLPRAAASAAPGSVGWSRGSMRRAFTPRGRDCQTGRGHARRAGAR